MNFSSFVGITSILSFSDAVQCFDKVMKIVIHQFVCNDWCVIESSTFQITFVLCIPQKLSREVAMIKNLLNFVFEGKIANPTVSMNCFAGASDEDGKLFPLMQKMSRQFLSFGQKPLHTVRNGLYVKINGFRISVLYNK